MYGFLKKIYDSCVSWGSATKELLYRQIYNDSGRAIDTMYNDWRRMEGREFVKKICGGGVGAWSGYAGGYWLGSTLIGNPLLFLISIPLGPLSVVAIPFIAPVVYTVTGTATGSYAVRYTARLGYDHGDHMLDWVYSKFQSPEVQRQLTSWQYKAIESTQPALLAAFSQQQQKVPTNTTWGDLVRRKPTKLPPITQTEETASSPVLRWGTIKL